MDAPAVGPSERASCRVFTMPAGASFLDALAAGIWREADADPLRLARATVLLPTRRACRGLRDAFLRLRGGEPLLLPRMQPLGDIDDDELLLDAPADGADALDLPPAIPHLERLLLLTRLALAREGVAGPGVAARLAQALADLLDSAAIEGVSLDRLEELVPADFAEHWQMTLEFLGIVRTHWPKILAERDRL
ncbi:MAG: double-strand break repair protein AddB, partial [Rhodospirillales bacterium]|nr:double-strand break repair protein AddB [Rhodospirillales bacterium]